MNAKKAPPASTKTSASLFRRAIYISVFAFFVMLSLPLVFDKQTSEYLNKGDWGWIPLYSDLIVLRWCWTLTVSPIDHVEGQIYIGNVCAATDFELLQRHNISRILNTCLRCPTRFGKGENMSSMHLKLKDIPEADLTQHLEPSLKFIDEAVTNGENVLVHCAGGKSRSASIVIAHLIRTKRWTYDEALEYLRSKRQIVLPNSGFEKQLRAFAQEELSTESK